jgi:uncharacterized delta-60 repeat protein
MDVGRTVLRAGVACLSTGCFLVVDFSAFDTNTPPGSSSTARGDAATGRFELVVPPEVRVEPGSTAPLVVTIRRQAGFDGEVTIGVEQPPDGVEPVTTVLVGRGQERAELTVAATLISPGGTHPMAVVANSESGQQRATVNVVLQGEPCTLDRGFGNVGVVSLEGEVQDVVLDDRGRIVLAVSGAAATAPGGAVVRLLPTGSQDQGFAVSASDAPVSIALDAQQRIVTSARNGSSGGVVRRQLPDGAWDRAFGDAGARVFANERVLKRVAILPGDGVLALSSGWTMYALGPDGSPVASFGTNGSVTPSVGFNPEAARALVDAAGNIVVCGHTESPPAFNLIAERYTPTGAVDRGFADQGKLVQNDEKGLDCAAFAGGYIFFGASAFVVDASASREGRIVMSLRDVTPSAVAVDSSGRFVFAGPADVDHVAITRFARDGSLDSSFGTAGRCVLPRSVLQERVVPIALALQRDGRIVVTAGTPGATVIARLWP